MKKHSFVFPAVALIAFLLSGCLVYTVGSYQGTNKIVPRLWAFTIEHDLPIPNISNHGEASSVYVYKNTFYIAGYYYDGEKNVPCYWTSTTEPNVPGVIWIRTDLPGGSNGKANSIFVSGGTVYTAGHYDNGTLQVPCYWTDTTKTDLDSAGVGGEANSIFVSGSTVYTAGYYYGKYYHVPCYWTGTTKTDLDSAGGGGEANGIFVSGGTVYTAGYYNSYPKGPCNIADQQVACYWTGKTRTDLDSACSSYAAANSVYVSGNTVYTAGWYYVTGLSGYNYWQTVPSYWTGTTKTNLDSINGEAKSIYVSGSTVYTAGDLSDVSVGGQVACYWKGTTRTVLGGSNGKAVSIFVYP